MALPDATFTLLPNPADGIQRLSDPDGLLEPGVPIYPVENLAVSDNSTDSQEVSWSYPYDAADYDGFEYRLWDTEAHSGWQPLVTLPADARSYRPTNTLTSNSSIGHRVRAIRANGDVSDWAEAWAVTESEEGEVEPPLGTPDPGEFIYWSFGYQDYDSSNVHFKPINLDWNRWWSFPREELPGVRGEFRDPMAYWEKSDACRWSWPPSDPGNWISARLCKPRLRGEIKVYAPNIPKTGTIYFTIRHKDMILPGYNGCVVHTRGGTDESISGGYRALFSLGGKFDKRWKTEQFAVDSSTIIWQGDYFYLAFGDEYSNLNPGELTLDKIKISTTNHKDDYFEGDQAGFWPSPAQNKHANIYNDNEWVSGETPKFRFGMFIGFNMHLGQDVTEFSGSSHPNDEFQIMEDAGINFIINHSHASPLDSYWSVRPNEPSFPGTYYVEMGGPELTRQANFHNIEMVHNPLTHFEAYSIDEQLANYRPASWVYTDSEHVVQRFEEDYIPLNKAETGFGGWYQIDEYNHDGSDHKAPLTFCRWIYAITKDGDPDRAVQCSTMGYHRQVEWEMYKDIYDASGVDKYFYDTSNPGTWAGLEAGVRTHAWYIDDGMRVLDGDNSKIVYGIPVAMQDPWNQKNMPGGKRDANAQEIEMQAWMLICHDVKCLAYFRFKSLDSQEKLDLWEGVKAVGTLLFGVNGFAQWLVPPATLLDVGRSPVIPNGAPPTTDNTYYQSQTGLISPSTTPEHGIDIHFIYKELAGARLLIAFNGLRIYRDDVRINVDVPDGSYAVRGEGRNVTVSGGILYDYFEAWKGHAYELS